MFGVSHGIGCPTSMANWVICRSNGYNEFVIGACDVSGYLANLTTMVGVVSLSDLAGMASKGFG